MVTSEISEKKSIDWISISCRLKPSKMVIKNIRSIFTHFWHNQNWLYLLRPSLIMLLLLGASIFYFALVESEKSKIDRFKWVVSRALGVASSQVRCSGKSWVHIAANRTTAVDDQEEPVTYNINLWRWLCLGNIGYLTRWRGEPYGYDTNRLIFDKARNIWLKKEDEWQQGGITGNEIKWKEPQGTGIREGRISGHEIYREGKKEKRKIRFTDHTLDKAESSPPTPKLQRTSE